MSAFEALPKATVKFGIREGTPTYVKRQRLLSPEQYDIVDVTQRAEEDWAR